MLILQNITYIHPNRDILFSDIHLTINKQDKIALIGDNGTGKSTLLKILSGCIQPVTGIVNVESKPYYVPQVFGQFNHYTVAHALQVNEKLDALNEILDGHVTDENLTLIDDDWTIEERCKEACMRWGLHDVDLAQKMGTLSGGEKTKVFLAGIMIHQPKVVLLDEPSNHLDTFGRRILYEYIKSTKDTLVVVSHDRTLLNLLTAVYELGRHGIVLYGGNYDFYAEQKRIENDSLNQDLKSKERALRKAKEIERESLERQQKLDARGRRKQEKAGLPKIAMNTLRNTAERSTSRMKSVHAEKVDDISHELSQLRATLTDVNKMKMDLNGSILHTGKVLVTARDVNVAYHNESLWKQGLSFQIVSGERIAIKGLNGSGKTTLIKIILGDRLPRSGTIEKTNVKTVYIDQDYSLIDNELNVYQQAQRFNSGELQEHEIKMRLNRFLFAKTCWDKSCNVLSGGEKMRLMLCCLTIASQAPDIIVLDEPTNNLDINSIEILTAAVNEYKGTLIVVSHDEYFLKQVNIARSITIE